MEELDHMLSDVEGIMMVGKARSAGEASAKIDELSPDIILMPMGIRTPGMDAIDTIRTICEAQLPARVILMAENPLRYLSLAIQAGAAGLLPQNTSRDDMVSAIRKIHPYSQNPLFPARENSSQAIEPYYETD